MIDIEQVKQIQSIKHSDLFTLIKNADPLVTAKKLWRNIRTRPNTGLDVLIASIGGTISPQVDSKAWIQRTVGARGVIQFSNPAGAGGGARITIAGVPITSGSFSYVPGSTGNQVATAALAAIDAIGYSGFVVGNYLYIIGLPTDGGLTLDLSLTIGSLPGYTPSGMTAGGIFNHEIDYDFKNDAIYTEEDTSGNIWNPQTIFNIVSNLGSQASHNNFAQDGGSDFTQFGGFILYNNHFGNSYLRCAKSNAVWFGNNLYDGASVDVTRLTNQQTITHCNIRGVSMTLIVQQVNLDVSTEKSNYANDYALPAIGVLDYANTDELAWTGVWTMQNTNDLKNISNLNLAPKMFRIKAKLGTTMTIKNLGNIKLDGGIDVVLNGTKGDYCDFIHDGTNVYQYVAGKFV